MVVSENVGDQLAQLGVALEGLLDLALLVEAFSSLEMVFHVLADVLHSLDHRQHLQNVLHLECPGGTQDILSASDLDARPLAQVP